MITMLNNKSSNEQWDKYNVLFRKAWRDVVAHDKLRTEKDRKAASEGKEAFVDLADYFSYIKELISIDEKYILLPLDEKPFVINANTREIEVPPAFQKCSGVQSDNYAEIITFTIDRYFDYKDLDQANIAVQWINAKGTEGVSFIQLKDRETYGKEQLLRFGWPLTAEMTAVPGNLRFAVRFYTTAEDATGKTVFNYLFNTTPASIPIKSTLNVDFNGDIIRKETDYELFTSYITNSDHPGYGMPTSVTFVKPSLPAVANINKEDTLELITSAITKDSNPLIYKWYHEKDGVTTEIITPISGETYDDDYLEFLEKYTVGVKFVPYKPTEWPKEHPTMTFWVEDATVEPYGYKTYLGPWPEKDPGNLYVRNTSLIFNPGEGDITGKYYVKGINANEVNSTFAFSPKCLIQGPSAITVAKNLPTHMFLDAQHNKLEFEITPDIVKPTPEKTFVLKKKNENTGAMETVTNGTTTTTNNAVTKTLNVVSDPDKDLVPEFGVYQFEVTSELNRKTADKVTSNLCHVTDHPIQPVGVMYLNDTKLEVTDADEDGIFDWATIGGINVHWATENVGKVIKIEAEGLGQELKLKVGRNQTNETAYNVGDISYQWQRQIGENPKLETIDSASTSKEGDIISIDKDSGEIVIRVLKPESTDATRYNYMCTITNTLGGEKATSETYQFIIN